MKQIQQYIRESILDDEDDIMQNDKWVIETWLKDNYEIPSDAVCDINEKNKTINITDAFGSVTVKNREITSLLPQGYKFGKVSMDFKCEGCKNLKSLKGAPQEVGGSFICDYCDGLKNLVGGPSVVGIDYYCLGCKNLKSLKGASETCSSFCCSKCTKLTSLIDAPNARDYFDCSSCKNLKTLEGAPSATGYFYCANCEKLTTLKGAPKKIQGAFDCTECPNLNSFDDMPKDIYGNVYIDETKDIDEKQIRKISKISGSVYFK